MDEDEAEQEVIKQLSPIEGGDDFIEEMVMDSYNSVQAHLREVYIQLEGEDNDK